MGDRVDELLSAEGAAAEAFEEDQSRPYPANVEVRSAKRSKVLQVRLNPEEMAALEAIADRRQLPVSTVAREHLLALIAADGENGPGGVDQLLSLLSLTSSAIEQTRHKLVACDVSFTDGPRVRCLADIKSDIANSAT